jgi:hypothetical protein
MKRNPLPIYECFRLREGVVVEVELKQRVNMFHDSIMAEAKENPEKRAIIEYYVAKVTFLQVSCQALCLYKGDFRTLTSKLEDIVTNKKELLTYSEYFEKFQD